MRAVLRIAESYQLFDPVQKPDCRNGPDPRQGPGSRGAKSTRELSAGCANVYQLFPNFFPIMLPDALGPRRSHEEMTEARNRFMLRRSADTN